MGRISQSKAFGTEAGATNNVRSWPAHTQHVPVPRDFDTEGKDMGPIQATTDWNGRDVISFQDKCAQEGLDVGTMHSTGYDTNRVVTSRSALENNRDEHYRNALGGAATAGVAGAKREPVGATMAGAGAANEVRRGIDDNRAAHRFPTEDSGRAHKFTEANKHPQHDVIRDQMYERSDAMLDHDRYIATKRMERDLDAENLGLNK